MKAQVKVTTVQAGSKGSLSHRLLRHLQHILVRTHPRVPFLGVVSKTKNPGDAPEDDVRASVGFLPARSVYVRQVQLLQPSRSGEVTQKHIFEPKQSSGCPSAGLVLCDLERVACAPEAEHTQTRHQARARAGAYWVL